MRGTTGGGMSLILALVLAQAPGCSVPELDLTGRECPCAAGWTCTVGTRTCVQRSIPPDSSAGCLVYADARLYCANSAPTSLRQNPSVSAAVVNRLVTSYSWFECWGPGEQSAGSATWYLTLGDDTPARGWLPASAVSAPSAFHADPSGFGLPRCD